MKNKVALFWLFVLNAYAVMAQCTITGKIVDANGKPICPALISYTSSIIEINDTDGRFAITIPKGFRKLSIAAYGYKKTKIKVNGTHKLYVIMAKEDSDGLSESFTPQSLITLGDLAFAMKNYTKAFLRYRIASELQDSIGQFLLASMYEKGLGVEKNIKEAERLYQLSADQGYIPALTVLGDLLLGHDPLQSAVWYTKAAEHGDIMAQTNLGSMYLEGKVLKKDIEKAKILLEKAAKQNVIKAQWLLGKYYYEIEHRDTLSIYWLTKAAKQNDIQAQYLLTTIYDKQEDYNNATKWVEKAAEAGYAPAQCHLGYYYYFGKGCKRNAIKAIEWYKKSADQGYYTAMHNLGAFYEEGDGPAQNYQEALFWYEKAKEAGSPFLEEKIAELRNRLGITINRDNSTSKFDNLSDNSYNNLNHLKKKNERRAALVIGNSDYPIGELPNPVRDAKSLHKKLEELGFEVTRRCNIGSREQMETSISNFCKKYKGYDVAVFFYAGHAQQDNGINYFIPITAKVGPNDFESERYVSLEFVLRKMKKANIAEKIVIIDACRDYPGASDKGLARLDASKGFCLCFAAQAGEYSLESKDMPNSYYMTALLKQLDTNNKLNDLMDNVRKEVEQMTGGEQTPMHQNNLNETEFYFKSH